MHWREKVGLRGWEGRKEGEKKGGQKGIKAEDGREGKGWKRNWKEGKLLIGVKTLWNSHLTYSFPHFIKTNWQISPLIFFHKLFFFQVD